MNEERNTIKERIAGMTLREKIGQTGMPSPSAMQKGVRDAGSYAAYFAQYPFGSMWAEELVGTDGTEVSQSADLKAIVAETAAALKIPLLVCADAEFGGGTLFEDMTMIPSNMALGAAGSEELAYQRGYYWAKELRAAGLNWLDAPVCDLLANFFSSGGTRCISDDPDLIVRLIPNVIRGIQDAGMLATAKHYPGRTGDYRDAHFSMAECRTTEAEWKRRLKPIWEATFRAGDIGFDGMIVSDAVNMKAMACAFEHEDIYIECFNAGNDIVVFCHNDYIDVMERAVLDGRVSPERLDAAVERILRCKHKIGILDGRLFGEELTEADREAFARCNYDTCRAAAALLNNEEERIPFDPAVIRSTALIVLSPDERFHHKLSGLQEAFAGYGVETEIVEGLRSKEHLRRLAEEHDLLVYVCYLAPDAPYGLPCYSQRREINTLFHGLSYGSDKTVVVSFGNPTVYYNYFETVDTYINMYSANRESMDAFVDGLFGKFIFGGTSPVCLRPFFADGEE